MGMRWNRESFLVSLLVVMILFGLGYYGYRYLVDPAKAEAESSSLIVSEQEALMATYPPEVELLESHQETYQATTEFLPEEEAVDEAIDILEATAINQNVGFSRISRVNDRQPIDGLSSEFVKTTYQVEVGSESPSNIRALIASLMDEDRLWSIPSLTIQKQGEANYVGIFMMELMYRIDD